MHAEKILEKVGLKPGEAKVYLAVLQLGITTVSDIAEKIDVPRTSIQEILAALRKLGLVNPVMKKNHRYWLAENPGRIMATLKQHEAALQAIMPKLQALRHDTGIKPTVRTFAGVDEIGRIMDDIFETKSHILAIVSWTDWVNLFGDEFVDNFVERRIRQSLRMKLLTPKSDLAVNLKKRDDKELRTTRFLPQDSIARNSNFMYGNKVAVISLNRKYPFGIIIEDEDICHTISILFEALWAKSGNEL